MRTKNGIEIYRDQNAKGTRGLTKTDRQTDGHQLDSNKVCLTQNLKKSIATIQPRAIQSYIREKETVQALIPSLIFEEVNDALKAEITMRLVLMNTGRVTKDRDQTS